jgi:hypothetical protein
VTKTVLVTTLKYTDRQEIIDRAIACRRDFEALNSLYAAAHRLISHAEPVTEDVITLAENAIQEYIHSFRLMFPRKIIPKQHVLEHHCVEWMKKYRFGLGMHGEQGIEMLHSTVARLEKRSCGIKNEGLKMKHMMESVLLQTAPELHSFMKS